MTRMLMIAAMFGLAVAATACTQSNSDSLAAANQPFEMTDAPPLSGPSIPEPVLRPIDFQDSRTYGNNGGA